MRTIHGYITRGFVTVFSLTLLVFTMVMCLGLLFRVNDLLARGVPWRPIVQIVMWGVPSMLSLSIPVSLITASLLLFGRLSSDGEIMALKACGVGVRRVMLGPLLVALVLALSCLYINQELAPRGLHAARSLKTLFGVETPLQLLEVGRYVQDFPGVTIYVGAKDGDRLTDVRIWDTRSKGLRREVRARRGVVKSGAAAGSLVMHLFDVKIDPVSEEVPGAMYCRMWLVELPDLTPERNAAKRTKDKRLAELIADMGRVASLFPDLTPAEQAVIRMGMSVELHKRFALAASCLAFVLLGVPLGIKAHRKESTIGVGLSLVVVFNFYLFVIVAQSLAKHPGLHPDLIIWTPVALSVLVGDWLIRRGR